MGDWRSFSVADGTRASHLPECARLGIIALTALYSFAVAGVHAIARPQRGARYSARCATSGWAGICSG